MKNYISGLIGNPRWRLGLVIDENGLPISNYGFCRGKFIGNQRSVVCIADRALDYYNKFLICDSSEKILISYIFELQLDNNLQNLKRRPRSKSQAMLMFLNCANWLNQNVKHYKNYSIWEYQYASFYDVTFGWRSGHAQSMAIQVLLRAHQITGDNTYFDTAKRAMLAFHIPTDKNGLTDMESNNCWWYEKFADVKGKRPRVLNGMMFALLGINDYYQKTNNNDAKLLFEKGVNSLKKYLHKYDTGDWSYYNRFGMLASEKYHYIHVRQLEYISRFTNDEFFKNYHEKFRGYYNNVSNKKWYIRPLVNHRRKIIKTILDE